MGLFSRKDTDALAAEAAPFEALRRSPRNTRKPRATSASGTTDFDGSAPLDPAEASKTRARRRLIGAVALALAAIVFVPMLFDRTPVSPTDDIALQIPDRDAPFEGRRGVPDAGRTPLKPSSELPSVATPATEAPAIPETAAVAPEPAPADVTVKPQPVVPATSKAAPVEKPFEKSAEKSVEKPVEKLAEKPRPAPAPVTTTKSTDDPRALAALEGKDESVVTSSDSRQYAVQIAAFSAADKARGMRDQLVANGLKSYVESVSTAQGLRTRVRLGPFASRDAADRAKQKLKTMKLDGSVVPL